MQVRHTGVQRDRVAPMAAVSYTLFPFSGKVVDARAYDSIGGLRGYLERAGLSAQVGVSMSDPTEEFFLGLGTEPFPGVSLGWGMHTRYSEVSRHAGEFVADNSGEFATDHRWRRSFKAVTLTIDADVFVNAISGLWK